MVLISTHELDIYLWLTGVYILIKDINTCVLTVYNLLINCFPFQGFSCVDLQNAGMRQSGVYYLQIRGTTYWFLKVFCEQEIADGGWTVSDLCNIWCNWVAEID